MASCFQFFKKTVTFIFGRNAEILFVAAPSAKKINQFQNICSTKCNPTSTQHLTIPTSNQHSSNFNATLNTQPTLNQHSSNFNPTIIQIQPNTHPTSTQQSTNFNPKLNQLQLNTYHCLIKSLLNK